MSFKQYFKEQTVAADVASVDTKMDLTKRPCPDCKKIGDKCKCKTDKTSAKLEEKENKSAEELLRAAKVKIKDVFDNKFGTQIDLFRAMSDEDLKDILGDIKYKLDGKSILVIK